jgi:FMN phosphatase YigB (HAD superfamily)
MSIAVIFFDLGETLVTSARHWLPNAKQLLHALNEHGLKLGIISNTGDLATRQAILNLLPPDFDLSVFEANLVLFSSEVGKEKPGRPIFDEAVARSGRLARECLYCSENIVETLMAQSVGMLAVRVQTSPNNDLATLLKSLTDFQALPDT